MAVGLAISSAAAALQGITGAVQVASANKKKKGLVRPVYETPEEIEKNKAIAEHEATYGLDANSKLLATQGADRAIAASLYGGQSRRAGTAGAAGIVQAGADAALNLASEDQRERARKMGVAMGARSESAAYKDKEFTYNKADPFAEKVAEVQALQGAGMQNIGGALNTAAMAGMYTGDSAGSKTNTGSVDGAGKSIAGAIPGQKTPGITGGVAEDIKAKAWYMSLTPEQKKYLALTGKIMK